MSFDIVFSRLVGRHGGRSCHLAPNWLRGAQLALKSTQRIAARANRNMTFNYAGFA
jgi:hypothetical protein